MNENFKDNTKKLPLM